MRIVWLNYKLFWIIIDFLWLFEILVFLNDWYKKKNEIYFGFMVEFEIYFYNF